MKSPSSLILASTSVYRRELLERLRLSFSCIAPRVAENPLVGERPQALAVRLARAKAGAIALEHPASWVIGSDQVAVLGDPASGESILGKPGGRERCIEQLRSCSGRPVSFITAVAVVRHEGQSAFEFVDTTRVVFRALDEGTIARYVALAEPFDCAGGFKSEGLGISLCESIDNEDPTGLIGLPLIRLSSILRGVGFDIP